MDLLQRQMTVGVIFAERFHNLPLMTEILDWLKHKHDDLKVITAESGKRSAFIRDWCNEEGHEYELHTVKKDMIGQMISMIDQYRPDYLIAFQEDADVTKAVQFADELGVYTLIITRWRNVKSNQQAEKQIRATDSGQEAERHGTDHRSDSRQRRKVRHAGEADGRSQ